MHITKCRSGGKTSRCLAGLAEKVEITIRVELNVATKRACGSLSDARNMS